MNDARCELCKFYVEQSKEQAYGECRRGLVVMSGGRWPLRKSENWCGEFRVNPLLTAPTSDKNPHEGQGFLWKARETPTDSASASTVIAEQPASSFIDDVIAVFRRHGKALEVTDPTCFYSGLEIISLTDKVIKELESLKEVK